MFFCITFGTQEFKSPLKGYEHITTRCLNCNNWRAYCIKDWEWITICFIPILPLSFHPYKEVECQICHFRQDLRDRPDIEAQRQQGPGQIQMTPQAPPAPNMPQYK
ncbi:hypothetical protein L228DRAFT_261335 [Xylona heveae TC161]|uniref:Zinc-ribbon 15 domain-containing protein n=1 Tax=Xylona heveae (strain CBS 132557 / TC161) TaxID=1328760 RepID=A0A165GFC6_XYLHT|nr:hypothetical protein L228DRAFT_261335 [Xylona heveae TC161]KZF22116.1 hypothetical protein L228DRAFT_261335 [Xylona heveae TC161]